MSFDSLVRAASRVGLDAIAINGRRDTLRVSLGADALPDWCVMEPERVQVMPVFARADLPRLLGGHHIKLFPPLVEGFGLALLEAMACGLAPVTTQVGGPATLVRDGENGLVVEPGRSDALAAALERLLVTRPLLHRFQQEARSSARRYGITRVADETLAIYGEALARLESATAA